MRDAFGSTFMFKIIIIFIVLYVAFMTIAVSYAKVFRIKNNVINILEQNQYGGEDDIDVIDKIDSLLNDFAYDASGYANISNHCDAQGINSKLTDNGVCIVTNQIDGVDDEVYYTVVVYLIVEFPFFNFNPVIPIYGETENVILFE